jgi:pimeloyl-ACP methyl ester carboxylesterase
LTVSALNSMRLLPKGRCSAPIQRGSEAFALVFGLFLGLLGTGCQPHEAVSKSTERLYDWAGSKRLVFLNGQDTMVYRTIGQGPDTLLLIHGFGPFPAAQWEPQALALADSSFVIIPDMLFFGQSNGPDTALMPQDQAAKLESLLDVLGVRRFRLAGHSYGGLVSLALAQKMGPDRVKAMLLIDPLNPFFPRTVLNEVEREAGKPIEHVLVPSAPSDLPLLLRLTFSQNVKIPESLSQKMLEAMVQKNPTAQRSLLRVLKRREPEIRSMLLPQGIPTVLVWGANDQLIPLSSGVELQRAMPGSILLVKPHNGHTPHLESPVSVIQIFRRWRASQGVKIEQTL